VNRNKIHQMVLDPQKFDNRCCSLVLSASPLLSLALAIYISSKKSSRPAELSVQDTV